MLRRAVTVVCVSLLTFAVAGTVLANEYVLAIGLPTGGSASYAFNMNANGEIVGGTNNKLSNSTAFTWQNGIMTSLGKPTGFSSSMGYGINDSGAVVGIGLNNSGPRFTRACTIREGNGPR